MNAKAAPGPSVSIYFDGLSGTCDVSVMCDVCEAEQHRCRCGSFFVEPPKAGDLCHARRGCVCRSPRAQVEALRAAFKALEREYETITKEFGAE